jgi:hypothetical protein
MPDVPPEIRTYLAESHPESLELTLWVRELVLEADPDLTERLYRGWDGLGFRHPDAGYVCAIYPREDEVRLLFEHGARLDDPHGILTGEGTQTRFISVRQSSDNLAVVINEYVRDAVAERLFHR